MQPSVKFTELTVPQQTIVECVRNLDKPLPRSAVAKLLAGSRSTRVEAYVGWSFFGRLSHLSRKSILHYTDTVIQQGFIDLDTYGNLIVKNKKGKVISGK